MDRNRLLLFIAISAAITFGFQALFPGRPAHRPAATPAAVTQTATPPSTKESPVSPAAAPKAPPKDAPRLQIAAPRVLGSISLIGARLDDLRLKDYHLTVEKTSPLVRVLAPAEGPEPAYIQLGWSAPQGVAVPDDATLWKADGETLTESHPVTLTWDNGQGQIFALRYAIDRDYLLTVRQEVRNTGDKPVQVLPWQRARRDFQPKTAGYSVLFEGMMGVADGRTHDVGWQAAAKASSEATDGNAYTHDGAGGWAGFTDAYWLTALIPAQTDARRTEWLHSKADGTDHYQVSYRAPELATVAPGAISGAETRLFAGAKEVRLLDRYEARENIPLLSYAVDWGRFFFLTKPFFYAIDFFFGVTGNFGIAILIFTVLVKAAFTPLAARSYRAMGKMRLLAPKIQAVRDRYKDDPAKQQQAMMDVYKEEGISPMAQAGGCLPMLIQIPVFFSLYKVILVTIEMRHAPFFGWIRDLSATDPTNVFNLFGLLPFNPALYVPQLHLGIWPLVLGTTMYFQQKLNPPPPDPVQARMFQFMPILFTFMMGGFPAGLVIYWSWNNLLTIGQQWYIQKGMTLGKAKT